MFKVELFSEASVKQLQERVNEWLHLHKDISVHQSDMNTAAGDELSKEYNFYVLYTTTEGQAEALKEMAAEVQSGNSIEATEINPEVLLPTS